MILGPFKFWRGSTCFMCLLGNQSLNVRLIKNKYCQENRFESFFYRMNMGIREKRI